MGVNDLVEILVVAANLGIFLMIVLMISDRLRIGWDGVKRQVQDVSQRRAQAEAEVKNGEKVLADEKDAVVEVERQIETAQRELAALERRHQETDLPVVYTVTPAEGIDPRFPAWRLNAFNPQIGQRAWQISDPAYQWNEGRTYEIPAPNHAAARAVLEKILPPADGFFVRLVEEEKSGVA